MKLSIPALYNIIDGLNKANKNVPPTKYNSVKEHFIFVENGTFTNADSPYNYDTFGDPDSILQQLKVHNLYQMKIEDLIVSDTYKTGIEQLFGYKKCELVQLYEYTDGKLNTYHHFLDNRIKGLSVIKKYSDYNYDTNLISNDTLDNSGTGTIKEIFYLKDYYETIENTPNKYNNFYLSKNYENDYVTNFGINSYLQKYIFNRLDFYNINKNIRNIDDKLVENILFTKSLNKNVITSSSNNRTIHNIESSI